MDCLQLSIPPLPHFITVGHATWAPGIQHFRRSFEVYDLLIVTQGTLYMTEDDTPYEIGPGQMLVLEPGRVHYGHRPCETETDIYWVHFVHPSPPARCSRSDVPWSAYVQKGTDKDLSPLEQSILLPKYMAADLSPLLPTLDAMTALHDKLDLQHVAELHALFVHLLAQLQSIASATGSYSRVAAIGASVERYLAAHVYRKLEPRHMEEQLHFAFDYLARCLKTRTGMSPLKYQQFLRMTEAKRLLSTTDLSVAEIAARVGFDDANYFIRLFRARVGCTPGVYRSERQRYV